MEDKDKELTEEELFIQRLRNSDKYKAAEAWLNGTEKVIDKTIEFLKTLRDKIIEYKEQSKVKVKKR